MPLSELRRTLDKKGWRTELEEKRYRSEQGMKD